MALSAFGAAAGPNDTDPAAAIMIERTGDSVRLAATVRNLTPDTPGGRYEFEISKTGPSGSSTIRQGGALPTVTLGTGATVLSATRVSLGDGDRIVASLRVVLPAGDVLTDRVEVAAAD